MSYLLRFILGKNAQGSQDKPGSFVHKEEPKRDPKKMTNQEKVDEYNRKNSKGCGC